MLGLDSLTPDSDGLLLMSFSPSALCCLLAQPCPTLRDPMGCSPRLLWPWDSPGKNTGMGCHAFLQGNLPSPGIELKSPTLKADSLPSESPGQPFCRLPDCGLLSEMKRASSEPPSIWWGFLSAEELRDAIMWIS